MNVLLDLQLNTRGAHLAIEEILENCEKGMLSKEKILEYRDMLKNDILRFDETCEIIKLQGLECYSKNI
jgi:hypothetical protein